jgi:hypothetical protein
MKFTSFATLIALSSLVSGKQAWNREVVEYDLPVDQLEYVENLDLQPMMEYEEEYDFPVKQEFEEEYDDADNERDLEYDEDQGNEEQFELDQPFDGQGEMFDDEVDMFDDEEEEAQFDEEEAQFDDDSQSQLDEQFEESDNEVADLPQKFDQAQAASKSVKETLKMLKDKKEKAKKAKSGQTAKTTTPPKKTGNPALFFGVIGGIVGLIVIGSIVFYYIKSKREKSQQAESASLIQPTDKLLV